MSDALEALKDARLGWFFKVVEVWRHRGACTRIPNDWEGGVGWESILKTPRVLEGGSECNSIFGNSG